ncbi:MAG: cytochrome c maturation protein CcmE [Cytophagales bacterium]|nr:MAG: cytochrome c maturation protein CcmE [Cytophagales bacterium]
MKPIHIVAILVVAVAVFMLVSTAGDASKYVSFKEAKQLEQSGDDSPVHIVGQLKKDAKGNILGMEYNPQKDPNYFSFVIVDNNGEANKVIYDNPKPADFERSEQVVIIGTMKNGQFYASQILMKCPSKYQENTLETKAAKKI